MTFYINTFSWLLLIISNLTIYWISFFVTIQIKKSVEAFVRFFFSSSFSSFSSSFFRSFSSFFSSFVSSISLHRFYSFDRRFQHLLLFDSYIISSRFCLVIFLVVSSTLQSLFLFALRCFQRCHNNKKVMFIVCYISHVNDDFKLSIQLFWESSLASESVYYHEISTMLLFVFCFLLIIRFEFAIFWMKSAYLQF